MGNPTFIQKYITWPLSNLIDYIEYYFAKRWLDKNFGEDDYWGDTIGELLSKKHAEDFINSKK